MSEEKNKKNLEIKAEQPDKTVGNIHNEEWQKTKEVKRELTKEEQEEKKIQIDKKNTDETIIYCSRCGSKNRSNANYCSKCGAKIVISQNKMEDSAKKIGESIGKVAKKGWVAVSAAGKGFMNGIQGEESREKPAKEENK